MADGTCSIEGCERRVSARGYCQTHYMQWYRGGGREAVAPHAEYGSRLRFVEAAARVMTDECIVWPFPLTKFGYGRLLYKGEYILAHRLALILHSGPPSDPSLMALHGPCNTPACLAPKHLYWGDAKRNADDRERDGSTARGERHGKAKLTEAQVREIRASSLPGIELAEIYGVTDGVICRARNRVSWRHVD